MKIKKGTVYLITNKRKSSCHNAMFIITKDITEEWKQTVGQNEITKKERIYNYYKKKK